MTNMLTAILGLAYVGVMIAGFALIGERIALFVERVLCRFDDLQSPRNYGADQCPHQCADWRGVVEIDPIHGSDS